MKGIGVRTTLRNLVVAIVGAGIVSVSAALAAGPTRSAWSHNDIGAVSDAAIEASAGFATPETRSGKLLELAEMLFRLGETSRAHAVILDAAHSLPPAAGVWPRGNVIQSLVRGGDIDEAKHLIEPVNSPAARLTLLGKLGAAQASAGDPSGAVSTARSLVEMASRNLSDNAVAGAHEAALADIALALNHVGADDAAFGIAERMADGYQKARIIGEVARARCISHSDDRRGQELVRRAGDLAKVAATDARDFHRIEILETAIVPLVACQGAKDARMYVDANLAPAQRDLALNQAARLFSQQGQFGLARNVDEVRDPLLDPVAIVEMAKRLVKAGDLKVARSLVARAAASAVQLRHDPNEPLWKWFDHCTLLGDISSVQVDVGAFDEAAATVQPIEAPNRAQYLVNIVQAEARQKDTEAMSKTLPIALREAVNQPLPVGGPINTIELLTRITLFLAEGGFTNLAQEPFRLLESTADNQEPSPPPALTRTQPSAHVRVAAAQAAMGDIRSALVTADAVGPMVVDPSMGAILLSHGLAVGTKMAGPKAEALHGIARELVLRGDLQEAQRIESQLEVEPRAALTGLRDSLLAQIAKAQADAGDLRASYSTTSRMTQAIVKWDSLLHVLALSVPRP